MTPTTIKANTDYEVAGDFAVWNNGRLLRGVWVSGAGQAWAGLILSESGVECVDLTVDEDGELVPAHDNWELGIVRTLTPVNPSAIVAA